MATKVVNLPLELAKLTTIKVILELFKVYHCIEIV